MKLWKIMLAMLVAVLMISAVAMADDEHECSWTLYSAGARTNLLRTATTHTEVYGDAVWKCACGAQNTDLDYVVTTSHDKTNKVVVKTATCGAKGLTTYTCDTCGQDWKEEPAASGEHLWSNEKRLITEGDCYHKGYKAYICLNCGHVDTNTANHQVLDFGPHKWDEGVVTAPVCGKDGYTTYTCAVCHISVQQNETTCQADYAWKVLTPKTCTTAGEQVKYCKTCGLEVKGSKTAIPASHNIEKIAPKASTCKDQGWYGYAKCKDCGKLWNYECNKELDAIPYRDVNENDHEVLENGWTYVYDKSCTSTLNYKVANCIICGKELKEMLPAGEHKWADPAKLSLYGPGTYAGIGVVTKQATCEENGEGYVVCVNCTAQKFTTDIPARGHKYGDWQLHQYATCTDKMMAISICKYCKDAQYQILGEALGHSWETKVDEPATCEKDGSGYRKCLVCKVEEPFVVIPATGHTYTEKVTAATCTKDGKIVKTCSVCGDKQTEKIPAAHGATKEEIASKPACGVEGKINVICTVCDAVVGTKSIDALKHEYSWKATAPTPSANGKNEYVCALCGHVAETKVVKYTKMYYNNTMTSFGPMTRELVGGNDWYRVTPVDLTVDGVYTYDLIASNKYIVGKVTITVNAGTLTVSYKANGVDVKDEALLIYASKADLATGTAVTAPVGAAINAAETFGADSKVLVSLILTGDYDAAGKGLVDASAAAGMIANID